MGTVHSMPVQNSTSSTAGKVHSVDFDVRQAIKLALVRAGFTEKRAAEYMQRDGKPLDPSLFSRMLNGTDHVWFDLLVQLPAPFWKELLPLLEHGLGLADPFVDDDDAAAVSKALATLTLRLPKVLKKRDDRARRSFGLPLALEAEG